MHAGEHAFSIENPYSDRALVARGHAMKSDAKRSDEMTTNVRPTEILTSAQRRTLAALCDTFIAPLPPIEVTNSRGHAISSDFWACSGSSLGAVERVETALGALPPAGGPPAAADGGAARPALPRRRAAAV